jgi:hypothetical protein
MGWHKQTTIGSIRMTSQQRADKRKNDYILAMYDDGCTIAEITKQVTQSLLHIKNVIYRYRNLK